MRLYGPDLSRPIHPDSSRIINYMDLNISFKIMLKINFLQKNSSASHNMLNSCGEDFWMNQDKWDVINQVRTS
jgi:hypothetical protein